MLPVLAIVPAHYCEYCDYTKFTFEQLTDQTAIYMIIINEKFFSLKGDGDNVASGFCKAHIKGALYAYFDELFPPFPKQRYITSLSTFGDLCEPITDYIEAIYKEECVNKVMSSVG